jgi:hypothetical protein
MIRLIIISVLQCLLFSGSIWAQETGGPSADKSADQIASALANLRNPFLSTMPPPVKVEPPKIAPKVVQPPPKVVLPPKEVVKKSPPNLQLTGMVWGEAQPQAIINSKVMAVGDWIEGARVVSITKKGVQLSFEKDTISLTVDK